jgi:hypothetical protein
VAYLLLTVEEFTQDGRDFTDITISVTERPYGQFTTDRGFFVYPGRGVLVVRWRWDGEDRGINAVNRENWSGSTDLTARRFELDMSGEDPDYPARTLTAHLEGPIADLPPVAAAGPDQTLPCA